MKPLEDLRRTFKVELARSTGFGLHGTEIGQGAGIGGVPVVVEIVSCHRVCLVGCELPIGATDSL